ncbi:hypothetical protein BV898_08152 [Hypsibius exemplaris]|uniref:Uncharacterized protein n=1 Tax=Hypsibius exemplaris TaxID=2072580 RepID=A0A1W0WR66_HYPEX|nr:hypothetical protein BV898_08152 [Hypsibius exemplaris]
MSAFQNKIFLGFSPVISYHDAQALLMTDIQTMNQPGVYMISLLNRCDWSVNFRITCDDLDSGEKTLNAHQMCRISFWTESPKDTLVFCQTRDLMERTLNFDAWGGSAPRGLNVWSLLPDSDNGLALSGQIRKGWSGSVKAMSEYTEDDMDTLSEEDNYFDFDVPDASGFDSRQLYFDDDRRRPVARDFVASLV